MSASILAFALVAGAVAAFNPCGFALLPAYLGLLVVPASEGRTGLGRPVRFAAGMTLGFVAVFGTVGLMLAPLAVSIERYLPVITVVIGVLLVAVGGWLVAGRHLAIPGLTGRGTAPTAGWWSQVGYGVSFALASLSCTIAPFLAVTAGSVAAGGPVGIVTALIAYALGMGTVVLTLALAVAAVRTSIIGGMCRAGAVISRASGALLVVAGAYVAWYGWFEIRVLAGTTTSDPIVSAAVRAQAALSRWVASLGPAGLLAVGVTAASAALVVVLACRARARRRAEPLR